MQLPFDDGSVRRRRLPVRRHVLSRQGEGVRRGAPRARAGRRFLFNVWDRIEENEFADAVTDGARHRCSPTIRRASWRARRTATTTSQPIARDLAAGGFSARRDIATVAARSRAASPRIPALAYCQGTPLRNEIEARDASRLDEATDVAAEAIAQRFGRGAVDGKIQAHVVTVER